MKKEDEEFLLKLTKKVKKVNNKVKVKTFFKWKIKYNKVGNIWLFYAKRVCPGTPTLEVKRRYFNESIWHCIGKIQKELTKFDEMSMSQGYIGFGLRNSRTGEQL